MRELHNYLGDLDLLAYELVCVSAQASALHEALLVKNSDPEGYANAAFGLVSHIDRVIADMGKAISGAIATQHPMNTRRKHESLPGNGR